MKALALCAQPAACGKQAEPGADWSQKPLDATIENKVKNVAFEISVPKAGSSTPSASASG